MRSSEAEVAEDGAQALAQRVNSPHSVALNWRSMSGQLRCATAARSQLATQAQPQPMRTSSDSLRMWRRSEWPRMTQLRPRSFSISALQGSEPGGVW